MRLTGRVGLVTGGAGGLGSAIARALAREGAAVAVHARSEAAAQPVVDALRADGHRAVAVGCDVRDPDQVAAMVETVVGSLGGLDILVNNAGVMDDTPFLDMPVELWRRVVDTNLTGYFLVGQRAARHMAETGYGRIVNVASTRQVQANAGNAAYCSSKGGIAMLTRVMGLELAAHGIRVNAVAPGTIPTGLNASYLSDPEFRRQRVAQIPAGRLGRPADVTAAVVLLASDDADFMVGASLMVDGGQTLG